MLLWLNKIWTRIIFGSNLTQLHSEHLMTGQAGEELARHHLEQNGYRIIAVDWIDKNQKGDLDVIAWKRNLLCLIEVKTRTNYDRSPAARTVNREKRKTLRRMARQYMNSLGVDDLVLVRFDLLEVYLIHNKEPEFNLHTAAFGWKETREH